MWKKKSKKQYKMFHRMVSVLLVMALCITGLSACGNAKPTTSKKKNTNNFTAKGAGETIHILSGSENQDLETILQECAKKTKINIQITYKGSVDIMRELEQGANEYDVVWPASSLWISMGDQKHLVKQEESIYTTPVVFGIRESLAKQLGFVGTQVSVKDVLAAIKEKKMSFCMTSATQSNSGASAYIGFLYALMGKQEAMNIEDLQNEELQTEVTTLLSGIDRSSGSSGWLKEMFLKGNYDAMVNYEALIIGANQQLKKEGKETLYVVYPYDGLSIADSPFGYVDHGNQKKKEAFTSVQEYLLSEKVQKRIQKTGRRTGYSGVDEENKTVFSEEWGIDTQKILSPIQMPTKEVLTEALNLYQGKLKKPSLNVYCLDFSGSMKGEGNRALVEAMEQLLIQKKAKENFLQATKGEVNVVITFSNKILNIYTDDQATEESLKKLYDNIAKEKCNGGTDIYRASQTALMLIDKKYDVTKYTPAIILMTDGQSNGSLSFEDFATVYQDVNKDIPVFSITFGDAKKEELQQLADLTNAKEFDGTTNLKEAFKSVKGYN